GRFSAACTAAGMAMNGCRSLPPASSRQTVWVGDSDRRAASAQPAVPPPTITKSKVCAVAPAIAATSLQWNAQFLQGLAGNAETVHGRWHSGVDHHLQEHLADLLGSHAVGDRAAHVRFQLVWTVQEAEH